MLRHIRLEDEWLLKGVADGVLGPMPEDSDACGIMTPQDAVARYKERIPKVIAQLKALPGDAFTRQVDFLGNQMPALAILSVAVRHSTHHRGQPSTYLRPMGGKVRRSTVRARTLSSPRRSTLLSVVGGWSLCV